MLTKIDELHCNSNDFPNICSTLIMVELVFNISRSNMNWSFLHSYIHTYIYIPKIYFNTLDPAVMSWFPLGEGRAENIKYIKRGRTICKFSMLKKSFFGKKQCCLFCLT